MAGYIFLCDNITERECLKRLLFGTSNAKIYTAQFRDIRIGDWLFLYNYQQYTLRGLYRALTGCGKEIEPDAWTDAKGHGFPFQVRVAANGEFQKPLLVHEIEQILPFYHTKIGKVPNAKIADNIVKELIGAFQKKSNDFTPVAIRIPAEQLTSRAYIFKCNRVTGGKCFDDNVMGAPVSLFKPVVSHVQSGDTIFLWLIEERKLFGVWKAKSRGQYDPTAFGGDFSAVVYCERIFNLERGLGEKTLRAIVPFDGTMPPYLIRHEQSQTLTDNLLSINAVPKEPDNDRGEAKYLCEDGHLVRSYSEIIIDNWLYNHHIVHAYEHRMQIGSNFLRSDFYLPTGKVFIEFWGLIGNVKYDSQRKKKLLMYSQAGVKLLELFPMDIPVLSEVLPAKLAQFGISTLPAYGKPTHEMLRHPVETEKERKSSHPSDHQASGLDKKPINLQALEAHTVAHTGEEQVYTYEIPKHGIRARMVIQNGLYTILKGSTANVVMNASMAVGHRRRKQELIDSGKLVREENVYVFTDDVEFSSPSEASGVVSGSSTNGWQCFGIPRIENTVSLRV